MSRFKIGDRVRCIANDLPGAVVGDVLVVTADLWGVSGTAFIAGELGFWDDRFELATNTPLSDPVQWLKIAIHSAEANGDRKVLDQCRAMLRECYGVEATAVTRTEWVFAPVASEGRHG